MDQRYLENNEMTDTKIVFASSESSKTKTGKVHFINKKVFHYVFFKQISSPTKHTSPCLAACFSPHKTPITAFKIQNLRARSSSVKELVSDEQSYTG